MVNRKRRDAGDVSVVVTRVEKLGDRVVRAVVGPKSGRATAMTLVYRGERTARTPVRSGTMAMGHAEPAVPATEVPCHHRGFRVYRGIINFFCAFNDYGRWLA